MAEIILVSVGNTHSRQALLRDGEVVESLHHATAEWLTWGGRTGLLLRYPLVPCLVACVVPGVAAALVRAWPERPLVLLEPGMARDVDFSAVDSSTLGADRVANAVAALLFTPPPVIVLDCGTAITTEVIGEGNRFLGGAIAPGRRLLRLALHEHTGQLPEVPMQDDLPAAVGTRTRDAILAGVDLGAVGAVRQLIVASRAAVGAPGCPVIVTGGDAPFFLRHLGPTVPDLIEAPADFTVRGLARIAAGLDWPSIPTAAAAAAARPP